MSKPDKPTGTGQKAGQGKSGRAHEGQASTEGKARKPRNQQWMPAQDKLDAIGLDAIVEKITQGQSVSQIVAEAGIGFSQWYSWIDKKPERPARIADAMQKSADQSDAEAERVLRDPTIEPWRARELAQHMRWRASKRAPQRYGDRVQVDATVQVGADELAGGLQLVLGVNVPPLPGPKRDGA